MKNEQKVISQPLAKKITNISIKKGTKLPESEMYWAEYTYYNDERMLTTDWLLKSKKEADDWVGFTFPAYDVAELGEIMDFSDISYYRNTIDCFSWYQGKGDNEKIITAKTEAEVRGEMYFYLLDNNLL